MLRDLKTLYHLAFRPVRGDSHAQRLESFYAGQAGDYDRFRQRLLVGRESLYRSLVDRSRGGVWIDFGGGTGSNLETIADRLGTFDAIYVVDMSPSLLSRLRDRCSRHGWTNVHGIEGDATDWQPPDGRADVVTFSYSLTMIPDWFAAIDNAARILRTEGLIGVVDFYVSRKYPDPPLRRHRWWTRSFWPLWFANDNVYPSADHLPYLRRRFREIDLLEAVTRLPYLPGSRMPYFQFIGMRTDPPTTA